MVSVPFRDNLAGKPDSDQYKPREYYLSLASQNFELKPTLSGLPAINTHTLTWSNC